MPDPHIRPFKADDIEALGLLRSLSPERQEVALAYLNQLLERQNDGDV